MSTIDIIGRKFKRLTVLSKEGVHIYPCGDKVPKYKCLCDCGKEVTVTKRNLMNGNTKSCGCLNLYNSRNNRHTVDYSGKRFSRLLVLERIKLPKTGVKYRCLCDCGKEIFVITGALQSGNTKSCGCLDKDRLIAMNKDPLTISKRKGKGYKITELFHWLTGEKLFCRGSYETKTVEWLNKNKVNFKWQIPFTITNSMYIVDLYLPDKDLYVEIKGYWWGDGFKKWTDFKNIYNLNSELWDTKKLKELGIL